MFNPVPVGKRIRARSILWVISHSSDYKRHIYYYNGAERVIVSQLVRSPGVYYGETIDTTGKKLYNATVIPNRGAWLELETDANDVISVRVDRTRKLPVTVLIRALGWASNGSILELFYDDTRVRATLERDSTDSKEEALVENL
ncbi:hypothetical protein Lal_00045298 [Lupinus albus]|nr:hypothetical protein Lal_00045298 [Lupinus albus]